MQVTPFSRDLGTVKTKWAINSAFMVFYAFASVLVTWGVWGYEMGFGAEMIPGLVGIPRPILSSNSELKQVSSVSHVMLLGAK
jgi:ammonium transporter, Amt family